MTQEFVDALAQIDRKIIEGPREEREQRYASLSLVERDLFDVNCFHYEYVSGGLSTYFANAAGDHWREALHALQRIGATKAYEALRSACELFPNGSPSPDPDEFEEQANDPDLQDRLESVEEIDDIEVMEKLETYWRNNARTLT